MADNEAGVAGTFSGEAAEIFSGNEDLENVIPKNGPNLLVDKMGIPKTGKKGDGPHKFFKLFLKTQKSAINAENVRYGTP
ncbi:spermidine/putrescine ABC transporter substrate-binding protein, partial [Listeria monocytogenes]